MSLIRLLGALRVLGLGGFVGALLGAVGAGAELSAALERFRVDFEAAMVGRSDPASAAASASYAALRDALTGVTAALVDLGRALRTR